MKSSNDQLLTPYQKLDRDNNLSRIIEGSSDNGGSSPGTMRSPMSKVSRNFAMRSMAGGSLSPARTRSPHREREMGSASNLSAAKKLKP